MMPMLRLVCMPGLAVLCLLAIPGHGGEPAKEEPAGVVMKWEPKFVLDGGRAYTLKTTLEDREYVQRLYEFMERLHFRYRHVFGNHRPMDKSTVYLYKDEVEFLNATGKQFGIYGFYTANFLDYHDQEFHVPHSYISSKDPFEFMSTLLHEATHNFVYESYNLDVTSNPTFRKIFPTRWKRLPTVPLWLNEGLASYMEPSITGGNWEFALGRINKKRLVRLQQMIRDKQCSVGDMLAKSGMSPVAKEGFRSDEYNIAWGIVFWMMHDDFKDPKQIKKKRALLADMLEHSQAAFADSKWEQVQNLVASLRLADVTGGDIPFPVWWQLYMEHKAAELFIQSVEGYCGKADYWEELWKAWILKLDPNDEYGGLRTVFNKTTSHILRNDIITMTSGERVLCCVIFESQSHIAYIDLTDKDDLAEKPNNGTKGNEPYITVDKKLVAQVQRGEDQAFRVQTYNVVNAEGEYHVDGKGEKKAIGHAAPDKNDRLPTPEQGKPVANAPDVGPPPEAPKPAEPKTDDPKTAKSPKDQPKEVIVFVTATGDRYHSRGCEYLKDSSIPLKLEDAKRIYSPCTKCNPPR